MDRGSRSALLVLLAPIRQASQKLILEYRNGILLPWDHGLEDLGMDNQAGTATPFAEPFENGDDFLHEHDSHPWWVETWWFSFFAPERGLGGWLFGMARPNQGASTGGAWIWDGSGHDARSARYFAALHSTAHTDGGAGVEPGPVSIPIPGRGHSSGPRLQVDLRRRSGRRRRGSTVLGDYAGARAQSEGSSVLRECALRPVRGCHRQPPPRWRVDRHRMLRDERPQLGLALGACRPRLQLLLAR